MCRRGRLSRAVLDCRHPSPLLRVLTVSSICAPLLTVRPSPPPETAVAGLSGDFTFTEMGGRAREVFKMFCS